MQASQITVLFMKRLNQTESQICFRDFVCSLFPQAFFFLFLFYSTVAGVVPCGGRKKFPLVSSECRLYLNAGH